MGNYCCHEETEQYGRVPVTKKKVSLNNPLVKQKYENDLILILNKALEKYSQEKSVLQLCIKGELGRGGQGSVFFVELTSSDKDGNIFIDTYAMKRVSKKKLDAQRTKQALLFENQILISHQSNFLSQIQYALQDSSYLYYLMDIAKGGDLFSFIRSHNDTTSQKAQFWLEKGQDLIVFILAGVVCGLEYLHEKDVIYRDLKPENILIFEDGYPKLADFGIAKRNQNKPCFDIKGTIIYLAPEMVSKKGYDWSIDLWALGVLAYQLIFKQPPFSAVDVNSPNFESKCRRWQENPSFPEPVSESARNLIKSLLKVEGETRLGFNSFEEIKTHPFFESIDWQSYRLKKIQSPLKDIVEKYPITAKISPEITENLQIEERQNVPFTFVKGARPLNQSRETSDITPLNQCAQSDSEVEDF